MRVLLAFLVAFIVAGCSGGGVDPGLGQFRGAWTGVWTSPSNDQFGSTTFSIDGDGDLVGTIHNVKVDKQGNILADVTNTGTVQGSIQYGEETPIPFTGTLTVNSEGQLIGNIFQIIEGQQVGLSLDARRP